jgi:hypothetical protein
LLTGYKHSRRYAPCAVNAVNARFWHPACPFFIHPHPRAVCSIAEIAAATGPAACDSGKEYRRVNRCGETTERSAPCAFRLRFGTPHAFFFFVNPLHVCKHVNCEIIGAATGLAVCESTQLYLHVASNSGTTERYPPCTFHPRSVRVLHHHVLPPPPHTHTHRVPTPRQAIPRAGAGLVACILCRPTPMTTVYGTRGRKTNWLHQLLRESPVTSCER